MLSDTTNMLGGETWVERGDKSVLKVEGCTIGQTYMMQGGYVRHLAAKAYNTNERLTMVTSYRCKDPMMDDCTYMKGMWEMSTRAKLNSDVSTYRLKLISERLAAYAEKIQKDRGPDPEADLDVVDPDDLMRFVAAQCEYLMDTRKNLIP